MVALVLGAVRARTAQALTVLILTALIAAVAAAGPWYALAAASRAADGDVAAAPALQRGLSVRKTAATGGQPRPALDNFAAAVRGMLPIPVREPVLGMTVPLSVERGDVDPGMSLSYREGFCDHVRLTGPCPAAGHEVAVSQDAAQQLDLAVGDDLELKASQNAPPVKLRVIATYVLLDPAGAYWSDKLYQASGGFGPAFTALETFTDELLTGPTLTYDLEVPAALIRGDDGFRLSRVLRQADLDFTAAGLRLVNPTGDLLRSIAVNRDTIYDGVLVALCQVLVLGCFAIGLAGRYTGRERRGDAALLKLRGSTRRGMLWLAFGQHLVPMLAGVLVGTPLGLLLARLLAGPVRGAGDRILALELAAAAVGVTVLAGLLVLVAVEAAVLRLPVVALLSRVSTGRRDWRADVVDLVLLVAAAFAAFQARAGASGAGLALVAPALVALAVTLLLARLIGRIADHGGGAALRAGRLRLGLTAAQASRRPGVDRVFALVAVAVAVFAGTAGAWSAGREARVQRSEVELGAPRVLTVETGTRTTLEWAVRHADPGGEHAMAAVVDRNNLLPMVAVDTPRLAAVAHWRPEYGTPGALRAAMSGAAPPAAALVTGGRLTLRVSNDDRAPVIVTAVLRHEASGASQDVTFGLLPPGEQAVSAAVRGCTVAPGCRLVRWQLSVPPDSDGEPRELLPSAAVTVRGLTQQEPPGVVLDAAALGDPRRWRSDFRGAGLDVFAAQGRLRMLRDRGGVRAPLGSAVYAIDAVLPVPVVMSGPPPANWQFTDPILFSFGGAPARVRVAAAAPVLPVAGRSGVLVDLETARLAAADGRLDGIDQVWLAADAPESVLAALRAQGLTIVGDDSVNERAARLGAQGTGVGATYALLAAAVGLLLAAATVAVATVAERDQQAEQLRALRLQGMPLKTAVSIGYAGSAALIVAGVLAGLFAAAVAQPAVGGTLRPFTDAWDLIPPPGALGGLALMLSGLVAAAVLGLTAWLSVRPLARELRGGRVESRGGRR